MASINSSDQRLSTSKRRLKPLMLRDYLLDDLSSCSSNGFKSFPRRQSSSTSVRRLLDAEIKRSGMIHHKPRLTRNRTTCGTAITHTVQKASTAFLHAVKLLPFPSTPSRKGNNKQGIFSRSFSKRLLSKSFWRKSVGNSRREINVGDGEIQWWRSAAFFPDFSLDQPSDLISHLSVDEETTTVSVISAAAATTKDSISGDSSSFGSEVFTNSEVVQSSSFSSSGESSEEVSNENDAVEDGMESGESVEAHDCDGSSVNRNSLCRDDNRKECENEEKEQLSPVSILECPFQDDEDVEDDDDDGDEIIHISQQNDEKLARKSKRFKILVHLEPLDLEKRIDKYVEIQEEYSNHIVENSDEESENRANYLFALAKSKIGETNKLLASRVADNLLLDYLQEENVLKDERLMVKKVEEWVMGKQEDMFMSWEVREKREVYVKEMKWDCINGDEKESVIDELGNEFFTSLMDELILDFSS